MADTPDAPPPLQAAVAEVVGVLDAIGDPVDQFEATREAEKAFALGIKGVRQRIAITLKQDQLKTWREIGQIMGNVTAQRAEQISRGK